MKVVDVSEFYAERGGGVRTYVDQKLTAAAEIGHELVVIAPGPHDREERRHGGRVLWVRSPPLPLDPRYHVFTGARAVHALLDRERPDVIEGSSPWFGGWLVARYPGRAKKSFVFHQDPVAVYPQTWLGGVLGEARVDRMFGGYWHYLRSLARRFDVTTVSAEWLARRLRSFGVPRVGVVPFGVDKAPFLAATPDAELRASWLARTHAAPGAQLVAVVSRLHPEKRIGTLIAAVRALAAQRPLGLVVFGDGPLAPLLRRAARDANVCFAGLIRDRALLARSLASADALLHGSSAETFGLVVGEALCAGLPLVVPDRGGAAELARDEHAETYRAGDVAACAAALARMLDRDREQLRQACRRAAHDQVRDHAQHFAALFDSYARLADSRGPAVAL